MWSGLRSVGRVYNPALNLVHPDVDRTERTPDFQHVDQLNGTCNLKFDSVGAHVKEILGQSKLVGMATDPRNERGRIDITEDRHSLAQFPLPCLRHRIIHHLIREDSIVA